MGKVMSVMVRTVNRFNVEQRAQKVISQDKPKAAPKFGYNLKELEEVKRAFPELKETLEKKDSVLDDRLKKVFVTSTDSVREIDSRYNANKPLPLNRKPVDDFEFGFLEANVKDLNPGYVSLRQVIQFLSDHQNNPTEWTAQRISDEFKLDKSKADDILEHFKPFQIHISHANNKAQSVLIQSIKENILLGSDKAETKPGDADTAAQTKRDAN